mmetsp:Transcript_9462/g.26975  ORF Transcript_9462/g.26975 Transcript_9462/m.26975 type:complete len:104 (+) Transcript_9462:179-490(+)
MTKKIDKKTNKKAAEEGLRHHNNQPTHIAMTKKTDKKTNKKNQKAAEEDVDLNKKDAKTVAKLAAQIPYHEGRDEYDEVDKIQSQIEAIRNKARETARAARTK